MEGNQTSQSAEANGSAAGSVLSASSVSSPTSNTPFEPANKDLIDEIKSFLADCYKRYKFNNAWDVFLSVLGISLSISRLCMDFNDCH